MRGRRPSAPVALHLHAPQTTTAKAQFDLTTTLYLEIDLFSHETHDEMSRKKRSAGNAQYKASKKIKVYISGLMGLHPLEKGIAYYYRGHYIYGQALNPIEPMPFATKKEGMMVAGIVDANAPLYIPNAPNLEPEQKFQALNNSMIYEWARQQQEKSEIEPEDSNPQAQGNQTAAQMPTIQEAPESQQSNKQSAVVPTAPTTFTANETANDGFVGGPVQPSLLQAPFSLHNVRTASPTVLQPDKWAPSRSFPSLGQENKLSNLAFQTWSSTTDLLGSSADSSPTTLVSDSPTGPYDGGGHLGSLKQALTYNSTPMDAGMPQRSLRAQSLSPTASVSDKSSGSDGLCMANARSGPALMISNPQGQSYEPPSPSKFFVPHDRAQYLAASAPGSRHASRSNTPLASRTVSPQSLHPGGLRYVNSTPHLNQLTETGPSTPRLAALREDTIDPTELSISIDSLSIASPRLPAPSRPTTPGDLPLPTPPLPGLGQTGPGSKAGAQPLCILPLPIGTGRPRAASLALNEAYNLANPVSPVNPRTSLLEGSAIDMSSPIREEGGVVVSAAATLAAVITPAGTATAAPVATILPATEDADRVTKCPIHGEGCDGVSVQQSHCTLNVREEGRGFKDLYPLIKGDDGERVMIDWVTLLQEARDEV
ncbi:hypothetical protein BS50DRAFT_666735 [Corynespora cassiicola Philippines]|uniref:Uncharacterized protein n=1 Tax=Corynespora cassiicola Philippines TaxID=1448308 RepID=A0A2T2NMV7_CORCC|nr:hypothetical protein BS50DRAFT_666735 [Corynespora cassiicola Philippines]